MPVTQFLTFCPGPSPNITRKPTPTEWAWAEALIWEYFRQDFGARFGQPYLVLGQLEYLNILTGRQTIDTILKLMATDFRNELAKVPLRGDIRSDKPGDNLKPDVLGIAVTAGGVVIELVEVTTYGQARNTLVTDVGNKLQALREKVLSENTSTLEDDYYGRSPTGKTPFTIGPSKWRPRWDQMVFPLPRSSATGAYEWICYWPTFRFNPSGSGGSAGVDGLVLYEIHSVRQLSLVPDKVLERLREEIKRKKAQGLTLTPWITDSYWKANPDDKKALLMIAGLGGIALLAVLAWALWPIAVAGGAVGVAEGSVATAVTTAGTEALTGETIAAAATANSWAVRVGGQILQSLGRPILYGAATQSF